MTWTHDSLAADLASHFRGDHRKMVWEDMQMGPVGSARPDVFVMMKSYTKPMPISYEVKANRSDFLSDVTSGKWMAYKAFSTAIFFYVPKDLVKKTEVPDGVGLMVRSDKVWRATKRAVLNDVVPDFWAMQKLLINGVDRLSQRHRHEAGVKYLSGKEIRKRFGDDVAAAIGDIESARFELDRIEEKKKRAESAIESINEQAVVRAERNLSYKRRDIDRLLDRCREILGLQDDTEPNVVINSFGEKVRLIDTDKEVQRTIRSLEHAKDGMERAMSGLAHTISELKGGDREETQS